jgi:hypothetical protein
VLFRSECAAEGIAIAADDDGNRVHLGRFQVMGVLSSLAEEKKCGGTSRLEKIENLTRMFLFPSDESGQGMVDVKAFEEQSEEEEEAVGCDVAVDEAAQDTAVAPATVIPSFAQPLRRSHPLPSGIRRSLLDAPELPYLAPKILRSPAKNAHISERQNKTTRWNMLSSSTYDADALLSSMTKSAGKAGGGSSPRRRNHPSASGTATLRSTDASALQQTSSFIKSDDLSGPSSPQSPSQSAKSARVPSSPKGKRVIKQQLLAARKDKDATNSSASLPPTPAAEAGNNFEVISVVAVVVVVVVVVGSTIQVNKSL